MIKAKKLWIGEYETFADDEGWALIIPKWSNNYIISKDTWSDTFDHDHNAEAFVRGKAEEGSKIHKLALLLTRYGPNEKVGIIELIEFLK